ncbi:MAG TPA: hypothetical protein VLM79_31995 [Kofleriaceae bacterium]|nr:hypothetical protein [Kofleriaceae bacterium]
MTSSRTSGLALACAAHAVWAACLAGAACGGSQRKTDADPAPEPPGASAGCGGAAATPSAPPTAIAQRRDTACEQLGPKLTACAVEDARADLAAGKITHAQLDRDIAPEVQRKNTEKFLEACKGASYSSRQVRVLEVCFRSETRCAPLLDCLGHLSDKP